MKIRNLFSNLKVLFLLLFTVVIVSLPVGFKTQAAEVIATVHGSVLKGTTSELLLLSTQEGYMEIKLDSDTDTSGCKLLLPGKSVYVSVARGNDEYLHAVKLASDAQTASVNLDSSTKATVTGTMESKTKDDMLFLDTVQGEMEIKLDTTTIIDCALLVVDKKYNVVCARGSDAYMHAISISDTNGTTSSSTTTTTTTTTTINASDTSGSSKATMSVTGTVANSTKEDILYLSTKDGEMQFKIDNNADTTKGMILTPGAKLTVGFYHGSDAYLHAVVITGVKESSSSATINNSSTATVTGTVDNKSTENLLYLSTSSGMMEIKLDVLTGVNNFKVLVSNKKVTVDVAYGSDAYWHATTITAQ